MVAATPRHIGVTLLSMVLLALPLYQVNAVAETDSPKLVFNSDGCSATLSIATPPITLQEYYRPLDELAGSAVDVFAWCPNMGDDTFSYMTNVAEVFGTGITQSEWDSNAPRMKTQYDNIMALHSSGYDPPTILSTHAHSLNMDFWPTLRMNDYHENSSIYSSKRSMYKRAHPELLLPNTWEFNYAKSEVRQHKLAILEELCTNYDVDGIELDFQRGYQYFTNSEVSTGITLMNDFMQQVRTQTQQIAQTKGHDITLAIRVPQSFEQCLAKGFDVEQWISQDMVDVVTPMYEGYYLDMNADVSAFVEAAQGTNVKVLGGLEARIDEYGSQSNDKYYAAALGYQQEGAAGTYLFNFDCCRRAGVSNNYTTEEVELFKNLGSKSDYNNTDKHYFITRDPNDKTPEQGGIMLLPADLDGPGDNYTIAFTVGDDVAASSFIGSQMQITLSDYNVAEDQINVSLNGAPITWQSTESVTGGTLFTFNNPPAAKGENSLVVSLSSQSASSADVGIEKVELFIDYPAGLYYDPTIYNDAVAYWPFEETSGTTVYDASSTTAINLDFQGNLNRVPGAVGNAIQADDEGGHNFLTTNGDEQALDLSTAEEFTVASWVNIPDFTAIASKMESSGNYRGWWFAALQNGVTFTLRSQNIEGSRLQVKTTEPLPSSEWAHIAVTFSYDSGDALRGVRFYLNGELVDAYLDTTWEDLTGETDNNCSFNVFGRNDAGFPQNSNAIVDELAIWKRALSPLEIANIYMGIFVPGDANRDGIVDEDDAAILATNWLESTDRGWWCGDFNGDGFVDDIDATIMAANWLKSMSLPGSATVPEPGVWIMLITATLFLILSCSKLCRKIIQ